MAELLQPYDGGPAFDGIPMVPAWATIRRPAGASFGIGIQYKDNPWQA